MFSSASEPERARQAMIATQLKRRGITDPRVLRALAEIPRERFVSESLESRAYEDRALPIDCGQTISQPYIVGLMSQALRLRGDEHVLEIGTGSGYQTAVLARLARHVTSIERHAPLSHQAARKLCDLGCKNVMLAVSDGTHGHPAGAPFDRVIVTAATQELPPALWAQLADGGIVVIPLGDQGEQELQQICKVGGQSQVVVLCKCRFVPLVDEMPDDQPEEE